MCWDTHIVALLPPSSSPPDSTTTLSLSLSLLSFSLCNPSLRSQQQTKRSFPSWQLNESIHSTSHAYQICQLINGRAGRTARSLYKNGHVSSLGSLNACIKKKVHQELGSSPTSRRACRAARYHTSNDRIGNCHASRERSAAHLAAHCHFRPDSAATRLGFTLRT